MEFVRPKQLTLSLDMAPLIDIVFQLLIFFMLSSSFLSNPPAIHIDLPKAVSGDSSNDERIAVSADREGNVFVNGNAVSTEMLKARLEEMLEREPKKEVFIHGDKDMPYKFFVEIMDAARQAGAYHVNVVHEMSSGRS